MDFCRNRSCGIFVFLPSSLAGCQALVSGNLSTRQTAHTVCFLLFFFFPSLWQSSRYRFASRLLPNCPSAVGNFTRKRHGSHFSCNVSLVRSLSGQIVIPFVLHGQNTSAADISGSLGCWQLILLRRRVGFLEKRHGFAVKRGEFGRIFTAVYGGLGYYLWGSYQPFGHFLS